MACRTFAVLSGNRFRNAHKKDCNAEYIPKTNTAKDAVAQHYPATD
jgi:hypothetical protein